MYIYIYIYTYHKHTHTLLIRTVVANFAVECIGRANNTNTITKHDEMSLEYIYIYIYIYIVYIITVDVDSIKQTAIKYIYVPPSCNLDAPRGGTTHIKHIMQVRFHRHIAALLLAADCNVPQRPPVVIRSFTFIQLVHTQYIYIYL